MKKLLPVLCMLLYVFCSYAQPSDNVDEDEDDDIKSYIDVSKLRKEKLELGKNAPPIDLAVEPKEGDAFAYFPQAGIASSTAQLSLGFNVFNNGPKKLVWEKVVYKYNYKGKAVTKMFETNAKKGLTVKQGQSEYWQNKRDYHVPGDVLFFDGPLPSTLTVELFFKDYVKPVIITKPLKPYSPAFKLPFKAEDLEEDEFWSTAASHGGNQQVFAYDLTVVGGKGGHLRAQKDPKGPESNENVRAYGKRIYAIADGEVVDTRNDQVENSMPGKKDGGKANEVVIRHGDLIIKYEHFQTGSINPALLRAGAKVKVGDFLGLAGNSGRSSGPHLHICVFHTDGSSSPLLFSNGYVTSRQAYSENTPSSAWIPLNGRGIPTEKSLIWPGDAPPAK